MSQMALTVDEINTVISNVKYKDLVFYLGNDNGRPYLQIHFYAKDRNTGEIALQKSRKWMLSSYMTETELVRTAHMAVEMAELHEVNERFKYKGQIIYNPHTSVQALLKACQEEEYRQ